MSEDSISGESVATRSLLWAAVKRLDADAKEFLIDLETRNLTSLEALWLHPRSDFQAGFLEEKKRLLFRLRQHTKLRGGDETALEESHFVCIECSTVISFDLDVSCPICGTSKWLELVSHISSPPTLN